MNDFTYIPRLTHILFYFLLGVSFFSCKMFTSVCQNILVYIFISPLHLFLTTVLFTGSRDYFYLGTYISIDKSLNACKNEH